MLRIHFIYIYGIFCCLFLFLFVFPVEKISSSFISLFLRFCFESKNLIFFPSHLSSKEIADGPTKMLY